MKCGENFSLTWVAGIIFIAAFGSSCADPNPKLVEPKEVKVERVKDAGDIKIFLNREVDILFVIDDSGSMGVHQTNLTKNVSLFTQGINSNQLLDYHIGVLTSNMDSDPWDPQPGYGWKGELNGSTKFVTRATINSQKTLEENLKPGIDGSATEEFFSPVKAALSQPLVATTNKGFYRPGAFLAVIFLTDSDDQSNLTATDFYKFLLNLKGGDASKVLTYGVYIPMADRSCSRSGEPVPNKLEELFKLTKAPTFGLCDVDYGLKLADLAADLVKKVGSVLYLSRAPVNGTITVAFGSQIIPNDEKTGWVYDPVRNALIFADNIDLKPEPPGTQVEVDFLTAEF